MAEEWPQFQYRLLTYGQLVVGSWQGRVQPIRTVDGPFEVLDDLAHDREVSLVGDEIRHVSHCPASHCRHEWMDRIGDLSMPCDVEIWHEGNEAPPRCWVLFPVILKQKHMWWDWSICAFLASDEDAWRPDVHTVADFVPHVLLWLVKWLVYDQTNVWIGAEHNNTPEYHLQIIKPDARCWCQSGRQYRECHREEDKRRIRIKRDGVL